MIHFEPIPGEDFTDYWNYSVESWTRDMKRAGLIDKNITLEEADAQVRKFIPDGLKTPGHYFLYVFDEDVKVGKIWLEVRQRGEIEAYLWDIFIDENFRGKGYGKKSMKMMEDFAKKKGATKISLNVFAYNEIARNLYSKTGYKDAAITMTKEL